MSRAGIRFVPLPVRRSAVGTAGIARVMPSVVRGIAVAARLIAAERPDAVVGMGSYASFAVVEAAVALRVPTLIHEQNAVAGRANRILGTQVQSVAMTFPAAARWFPPGRSVVTGLPVRDGIGQADKLWARRELGLSVEAPVLLVLGGSQGARSLNECVSRALDRWLSAGVQVLHICGKAHYDGAAAGARRGYVVLPYTERMDLAYAAADVVLCRAGAGTLSELAVCGLPSVLVPYPFAADDHQAANARVFADNGAAEVLSDWAVQQGEAEHVILRMLSKPKQLGSMAEQARKLARPRAAEAICELVGALAVGRC